MNSLIKLFHFVIYVFLLLISLSNSSVALRRLSNLGRKTKSKINDGNSTRVTSLHDDKDLKVLYYPQTLDHFNYQPESYSKFKQKYMICSKHWGGAEAKAPIFVFLGDEQPMPEFEFNFLIVPEYAAHLNALVVVIEHRFYGESIPYEMTMSQVLKNASVRGYFNSAQALADYAEVILHLKLTLNAHYSPVIVFGGSYGGMLASWMRLKYPHIAHAALASSAPVLYFDNIIPLNRGYYYVVNKDFQETSKSCFETIKRSWAEIDRIALNPNGLSFLSQKFNTCRPLKKTDELKSMLETAYDGAAQYYDASKICNGIDAAINETDILARIYAPLVSFYCGQQCCDTNPVSQSNVGWDWQTCSEMVMPIDLGTSQDSMFPPEVFHLQKFFASAKTSTMFCLDPIGLRLTTEVMI